MFSQWNIQIFLSFLKSLKISSITPNPAPFSKYLNRKSCLKQKFSCIGKFKKTIFIIPKYTETLPLAFGSMGSFSRNAPKKHQNFFLKMLGRKVRKELKMKKEGFTYISTGDLVKAPWLHFRISSDPTSYREIILKKLLIY